MKRTIVSLFVIVSMIVVLAAVARAAPFVGRPFGAGAVTRTQTKPNTSFTALAFPSPHPSSIGNVVFVPNGTAYFTDANNELASFTPAGVYTRIPVPHAVVSSTLLYSRGVLWMKADQGIVKVAPNGGSRRWLPLTLPESVTYVNSIVAAPDGSIDVLANVFPNGGFEASVLFRIAKSGVVTNVPISAVLRGTGAAAFGSDALLYFAYYGYPTSGIARLEKNGSLSFFPIANSSETGSFVESKGNIYFNNFSYNESTSTYSGHLSRITPAGVISTTDFPATGISAGPSTLAVDKDGNLWVVVNNVFGVEQFFLYRFNISSGYFSGPYRTGLPNLIYNGPAVAPDNSVWIDLPASSGADYLQPIGFGIFQR